jgi:spore coat polysaccharide biosynthesis protein SpsF
MRVLAIIQARTGSSRLPAKVLADLGGRPMLAHVIERTRRARCVDEVVVATTTDESDDAVAALAATLGTAVFRGPVDDVLHRYVLVVQLHPADVVVRITADCPLLDHRLIDRVVAALVRSGADYASNVDPPSYPDGYDVEAISVACLLHLDKVATLPHEREHVTAHIREHPRAYRTEAVRCRRDLSSIRLTVDVLADLERVRRVLALTSHTAVPLLGAVLAAMARDPGFPGSTGLPSRDEGYHAQRRRAFRGAAT